MKKRNLLIIVMLVGAPLATVYTVLFGGLFREFSLARAARGWAPVDARIVSLGTGRHTASRGGAYISPEVRYSYSVKGRDYESTRLGYLYRDRFEVSSEGEAEAERAARDLSSRARAYYNPLDPAMSALSVDHDYTAEFRRRSRALLVIGALGLVVMSGSISLIFIYADRPGNSRGQPARPKAAPNPVRPRRG